MWVNDTSGGLVLEQPHSGNLAKSGVSIQGYLSVAGDSLVVPTGRATPALHDRKTGNFRYFHLMKMGGGWGQRKGAGPFVTFINENLYIAEDDVFQASDGCFMVRGLPVTSSAVLTGSIVFSLGNEIKAIKKSSLWNNKKNKKGEITRALGNVDWTIRCSDPVGASIIRATTPNNAPDWPKATETVNPPLIVAGHTIVAGTLNNKIITADMNSKTVVSTIELDGLAMGLGAIAAPIAISIDSKILKTAGIFLISIDIIAYFFVMNGIFSRLEGFILLLFLFAYIYFVIATEKKRRKNSKENILVKENNNKDSEADNKKIKRYIIFFLLGLLGVVITSRMVIWSAINIAKFFKVSEIIIGLTVVAIGTSLPEISTSITAAIKGEGEIAAGDIIGADILNILWIIGCSAIVHPIHVEMLSAHFSFLWMLLIVSTMLISMRIGYKIGKPKGFILISLYSIYIYMTIKIFY